MTLTDIDMRALSIIVKRGPISCANLGDELWAGANGRSYGNCSCPFARPAGKVVKRLRALGLVTHARRGMAHEATSLGRLVIADRASAAKGEA